MADALLAQLREYFERWPLLPLIVLALAWAYERFEERKQLGGSSRSSRNSTSSNSSNKGGS